MPEEFVETRVRHEVKRPNYMVMSVRFAFCFGTRAATEEEYRSALLSEHCSARWGAATHGIFEVEELVRIEGKHVSQELRRTESGGGVENVPHKYQVARNPGKPVW